MGTHYIPIWANILFLDIVISCDWFHDDFSHAESIVSRKTPNTTKRLYILLYFAKI